MVRTWLLIAPIAFCLFSLTCPARGAAAAPMPVAAHDLLVGNGTAGPFPLSWTQVRFGSEQLSVNGTRLCPVLDYQIDDAAGTITFSQPLQLAQLAPVDYIYDASCATRNRGLAAVPLALHVWGSGGSGLQMIGAVAPDGSAAGSMLGFRGDTTVGGSQFSSLFLLAPNASGRSNASSWQTAALQFGASRTRGPFQFHASLGQAGAGFSQANDYQLHQGLRVLDLSAAFDPTRGISFTTQVKRQEALDVAHAAGEQTSAANQLILAPAAGTRLTLSQESTRAAQSQGPAQTSDALRAQLEQTLGSGAVATFLAERQHTASDTTSNLVLTIKPADQLGFHLGFNQHLNPTQGSASGMDWGLSAGRRGLIAVEGKTVETLASHGSQVQEEQWRVSTSPLRWMKVSELSATKRVGEAADETQETSLELTPLSALQVVGAFGQEALAAGVTHTRSVSGALKPAPFLDLSGAYKTRDLPVGDSVVSRNVSLALIPVHGFKLQGSYVENPEDPDGQVLNATDTSLSVDSTLGSLALGGSYTQGEGSAAPQQRQQSEFRLALKLWGHSRLYGDYKSSEERAGSLTENQTLSLGFTRSLSDHFYLLLEGDLTQVQVNGVPQPGMTDPRARAQLALRF